MQRLLLPVYLAFKEVWRNKGRFLLVSLVIALITVLVLFIAALGEGLGSGNREYLAKLDASLLVYQARSDFLIAASRLPNSQLAAIRRVDGVTDAGPIATTNVTLILAGADQELKVAMLGVEPGQPGDPPVVDGQPLSSYLAKEVVIDRNVVLRAHLKIGDLLTLRVTQGTKDEFFNLRVVGTTDSQQYSLQPSIFVPYFTWDRVRPKSEAEVNSPTTDPVFNVVAIKLAHPADIAAVSQRITSQVSQVQAATLGQAIEAVPGYTAQQSTIQTQGVFTLLIGVLVIGGFFQIQVLQKVAQIGVLKAIGASNPVVGAASVIQIIIVTTLGVAIGGFGTFLLSLSFPPTVPIVFNGQASALAVAALLLIGPVGGLVSIRYAVQIEPLKALGLS
jgi:putative ABC transport system permease protein